MKIIIYLKQNILRFCITQYWQTCFSNLSKFQWLTAAYPSTYITHKGMQVSLQLLLAAHPEICHSSLIDCQSLESLTPE